MATKAVTDTSFESDVLNANGAVLVDFWAESVSYTHLRAHETKVNIDENPETPGRYGVRGIPTLMIFRDGELAATKVGAAPKGQLVAWVNSVLNNG